MEGRMTGWIRTAALFLTLFSSEVFAMEVFQYIDRNGTIHFTNVPTDPRFKLLPPERRFAAPFSQDRRQQLDGIIEREAKAQGIEAALIKAVIRAESDFDPSAVSYAGAQGLMQLMPDTSAYLRLNDPFNPEENIKGGARHLRYLLRRFNGDLALTLAAYHAGAETVQRYGKIPPIQETRLYVEKVLRFYQGYIGKSVRNRLYQGKRSNGAILYTNHPERYPQIVFSKFKE